MQTTQRANIINSVIRRSFTELNSITIKNVELQDNQQIYNFLTV
jgi:hypothetical protein